MIIGAAIWSSVQKHKTPEKSGPQTADEESSLIANDRNNVEDRGTQPPEPLDRNAA